VTDGKDAGAGAGSDNDSTDTKSTWQCQPRIVGGGTGLTSIRWRWSRLREFFSLLDMVLSTQILLRWILENGS
jgi:hypothetical protein